MTHSVHLFAAARDLAGTATVSVELPHFATVADLRSALLSHFPQMQSLLSRCRIAVNHDFADEADPIESGVEIAVIPPVSGG